MPEPAVDGVTAERLALALDAASSHPTGTPNRTQVALAERMASWLATGRPGRDRPRRRATQDEATPATFTASDRGAASIEPAAVAGRGE